MKKLPLTPLVCVALLLLLGSITLYSASMRQETPARLYAHLEWIGLGLAGATLMAFIPYDWLRRWHAPYVLLGVAIALLGLVLVPGLGIQTNGARRWLPFGQPSELAKLALIIALAHYIAARPERMSERRAGFLYPALMAGSFGLLVFFEPDWGTAVLLAAVTLAMLLVGGTHWFYLASSVIIGGEVFCLMLLRDPVRLIRIFSFLDPKHYREGAAYQGWHSLLSLGAGGPWGTFFGEGSHKFGFVPEQETDFIFSLIGEELGFVGTSLVILLFSLLVVAGIRMALRLGDSFAQLLTFGFTLLIGLQAFINIGVVTSSLPNKGLPLPFVSYGGSNLVCLLAAVGLLVNVARQAPYAERGRIGKSFIGSGRSRVSGPIGSLLNDPNQLEPCCFWSKRDAWIRRRRDARFPTMAKHKYQRPPHHVMAGKEA